MMSGILPSNGVLPAATDGALTNGQYDPGCDPLFYPLRCNPRLDPIAMNTLISEFIRVINLLGATYDCEVDNNLAERLQGFVNGIYNYGNAGGSANAKTLTLPGTAFVLQAGVEVTFRNNATNTGAMTLNVENTGARDILSPSGNPMAAGDWPTGSIVKVIYDGNDWIAVTKSEVVVPPAPPSLGVGQIWQDMTGQRAVGTTYQNTTGKPIAVSFFSQDDDGAARWFEVSANGTNWVAIGTGVYTSGSQEKLTLAGGGPFVIPNGHYYRLRGAGPITLSSWSELR
jgi:hypothetical protein